MRHHKLLSLFPRADMCGRMCHRNLLHLTCVCSSLCHFPFKYVVWSYLTRHDNLKTLTIMFYSFLVITYFKALRKKSESRGLSIFEPKIPTITITCSSVSSSILFGSFIHLNVGEPHPQFHHLSSLDGEISRCIHVIT